MGHACCRPARRGTSVFKTDRRHAPEHDASSSSMLRHDIDISKTSVLTEAPVFQNRGSRASQKNFSWFSRIAPHPADGSLCESSPRRPLKVRLSVEESHLPLEAMWKQKRLWKQIARDKS